jgi:hypothetical protein
MKLDKKHISQIEKYLDSKELVQVDLRTEVLDHMAMNIENVMESHNLTFEDAFNNEVRIWNVELKGHSSFWLGWYWKGPKLMIDKCVSEFKNMFKIFFGLFTVLLVIWVFFRRVLQIEIPTHEISIILGSIYIGVLCFILIGYHQMKNSVVETSFKHLYKINAVGFAFMYLVFNPIWTNSFQMNAEGMNDLSVIFFHSALLAIGHLFWALFKKHSITKKTSLV